MNFSDDFLLYHSNSGAATRATLGSNAPNVKNIADSQGFFANPKYNAPTSSTFWSIFSLSKI